MAKKIQKVITILLLVLGITYTNPCSPNCYDCKNGLCQSCIKAVWVVDKCIKNANVIPKSNFDAIVLATTNNCLVREIKTNHCLKCVPGWINDFKLVTTAGVTDAILKCVKPTTEIPNCVYSVPREDTKTVILDNKEITLPEHKCLVCKNSLPNAYNSECITRLGSSNNCEHDSTIENIAGCELCASDRVLMNGICIERKETSLAFCAIA